MRWLLLTAVLPAAAALAEGAPSRRELMRSYFRSGELTIVYGAEDPANGARLAEAARVLASSRVEMTLLEASAARPETLRGGAVALVGTPKANPWILEAARGLPLDFEAGAFRVQSQSYTEPADSVSLLYPCPFAPDYPLFLVSGNSDAAVLDALERRRRGDVQVRRGGATLLVGLFERGFDRGGLETRAFAPVTEPSWRAAPLSYFVHEGVVTSLEPLAARQRALLSEIERLSGRSCALAPVELHLYRSLEDKGLVTDSTRPAHWEGNVLHAVAGREAAASRRLAERSLASCIPELPARSRDGLALALASSEGQLAALEETARRLLETSEPPALEDLGEADSPFVRDALTGSFGHFLLEAAGSRPLPALVSELDALEARFSRELGRAPSSAPEPPFPEPPEGFQHGVTFAHEGFDIVNGYLSERASRSLDRLRDIGVDAVAVVPYAFLRDPHRVEPLTVPTRAGSETDEDVVEAVLRAREKGMSVLLKPQIWLRGSWPGAIEPEGDAETAAFFREYRKWILHYALLAERYRVPLLAIGTELEALTRGNGAAWAAIIGDVRCVYRGKLVYAANWGREVQQVSFWPLLDYIGVDFYYPLSAEASASDVALAAGIEEALSRLRALSKRHGRPVLLTEIGYASTEGPWREPHASDRVDALSLADQARAYDVALDTLSKQTSWVRGMYWWKWPSDLEVGGGHDRGFTPNGKPAEDVLRRWYGRRLQ